LEGLVHHLFGKVELRWVDTYFPFTHPSFEIEIFFNGEWLEVLGSGVIRQDIIDKSGTAWRLAEVFHGDGVRPLVRIEKNMLNQRITYNHLMLLQAWKVKLGGHSALA
jgi:hypothetical protein